MLSYIMNYFWQKIDIRLNDQFGCFPINKVDIILSFHLLICDNNRDYLI